MARHATIVENFGPVVEEITTKDTKPTQAMKDAIFACLLHCADLNNPTKELHVYQEWTNRAMREFLWQGAKEADLGLAISPMCDRRTLAIESVQTAFIDLFVEPLWKLFCGLVTPEFGRLLPQLLENRKWYASRLAAKSGNKKD
ncbi:Phosphodiesterase [Fasciola hepatica]|uniref:Phosphodiesterase n=1 Tax=Fasciola hepatica TaxID=6192 RepID=A0A2H1C0X4_FASHE|nr:Phosphodiesterase [Fasciola hepatica]